MIAAPASGHGKTTIATGLMAALSRRGVAVSGHKVGPDYIDPGYHALATGRPGRNLDPHLVGEERMIPLLLHGATGAEIAVVEGVMGLYDGQLGGDGFASTAHVAAVTRTPVVLVVDISHASRSIAATVHGLRTWPSESNGSSVNVVGVILNKAGSVRHADEVVRALAQAADPLPVLGILQRDDGVSAPSRHLGLVPAAERAEAAASLDRLAAQVQDRIDLEAVVRLARSAPDLDGEPWDPAAALSLVEEGASRRSASERPVVAIAGGRAFTFAYAETTELLRAAGCDPVVFDPTTEPELPAGTRALYLGGGFPELHAADLTGNESLREQVRAAIAAGLPTVAECAGLLYLCRSVDGAAMVGALPYDAAMAPRLTLAYRTAYAPAANLLARPDETVTGHEFHRTRLLTPTGAPADPPADPPAWAFARTDLVDGVATPTLHASYLHTHWAGHPQLAARFAAAAHAATPVPAAVGRRPHRNQTSDNVADQPRDQLDDREAADPLRHHGDREATAGLSNFAVNVYDGPRPDWLEKALTTAELGTYPDPAPARAAIALLHRRPGAEVLPTAGAAEAFGLVARLRPWRRAVVVHPQFTEPEVALRAVGVTPHRVLLRHEDGFVLDPVRVPTDADLVIVGNPTNPTGVRHPAATLRALLSPGRLVVVDEAFLDDGEESLTGESLSGLLVVRSLTKLWSIPGVRAGYVVGDADVVAALAALQPPWSVSATAVAALLACSSDEALEEGARRVGAIAASRAHLIAGLARIGVDHVASTAAFVLARPGAGVHGSLRSKGFAVRRADTFPGLDSSWVRIAVRDPARTDALLEALRVAREAPRPRRVDGARS